MCPECGVLIKITYLDDGIEKWPNSGLPCEKCGKKWNIIR